MMHDIQHSLVTGLLLWSLVSVGTAMTGLYALPGEFWRSFWFMSGLWGLIDGLIAWYALVGGRQTPAQLLPVLRFNAGLDVLYLVVAGVLLGRKKPLLRGFGLGVFVQGGVPLALRLLLLVAVCPIGGMTSRIRRRTELLAGNRRIWMQLSAY